MAPGPHPSDPLAYQVVACDLGLMLVACAADAVRALSFGDTPEALVADLRARFPAARLTPGGAAAGRAADAAVAHLRAPHQRVSVRLEPMGSSFQAEVWAGLRQIPAGTTTTYGALADALGRPTAVRAVARACGANPIALLIPCHRVVGREGALTGYRWSVARKRALLARERPRPAAPPRQGVCSL